LGTVENGPVGVCAAYASRQGYAWIDQRLFLPKPWCTDVYAGRRAKGKVPAELTFQTKPQVAGAMIRELSQEGILPFTYVVADGLYGHRAAFRDAVETGPRLTSLVAIPADTRGGLHGPVREDTHSRYQGETRTKCTVALKDSAPRTVEAIAKSIMQSSSAPHRMKWPRSHPRLWYIQLRGGDWEEDVVTL
jgi:SRSO17 transposase